MPEIKVDELGSTTDVVSVIVGKDGLGSGGRVGFDTPGMLNIVDLIGEADGTCSLVGFGVGVLDGLVPGGGQVFFHML